MRNKKETVYRLFFLYSYHIPSICCINRLTAEIPTQQQKPIRIGLPPDLMSLTMLVLRPIAAIAITIKNLLTVLNGEKKASGNAKRRRHGGDERCGNEKQNKKRENLFHIDGCTTCLLLLTCTNERENKRNRYNCQRPCEFLRPLPYRACCCCESCPMTRRR